MSQELELEGSAQLEDFLKQSARNIKKEAREKIDKSNSLKHENRTLMQASYRSRGDRMVRFLSSIRRYRASPYDSPFVSGSIPLMTSLCK